jgi:hypothetical protein
MRRLLLPLGGLLLAGCAAAPPAGDDAWSYTPLRAVPTTAAVAMVVEVYKSPTCGCCHEWEAYLRTHGYTVNSIPTVDMASVKAEHRIPAKAQSCHTAIIGDYVVEGHVPVEAIEDLMEQRPAVDGISLPGMPPGSPGMTGDKEGPFGVLALKDGTTSPFGEY